MELERKFSSGCLSGTLSWNALLSGYAQLGDGEETSKLSKPRFSDFTLSTFLKICATSENARKVDMYSKCGLAQDTYKVFLRIKDPNVVAWSSMISCFNHQGINYETAEPNQFTLDIIISIATDLGDLQYGKSIYVVALTDFDLVSWNAFLSGFHDGNACYQGPTIFKQMFMEGFKPNIYTLINILRFCTSLSNGGFGQQVHAISLKLASVVMILWEYYTVCTFFPTSSNSGATDAFSVLFSCFVQTVNYTCLQLMEWHKHPCLILQLNQF
ncbi:hypothetical protein NE237_030110 [Protea cynaroides]|uniref:Pentatricopeptide repeat-containing protein n=1 Tax=Protea cynaroides TaxID=273540 RepID=A0A9Q0GT31_9MAGN|nr:hypothetical protein NE237_030110 [Protea cynaroides]